MPAPQEQQARTQQQEQRTAQCRQHLDEQQRVAREQSAQLQQQNRRAQGTFQQPYVAGMQQQQLRIQVRHDYDAYFREGFRRGYEDGYNRRSVYGSYVNGRGTMLGAILATIITFESIR